MGWNLGDPGGRSAGSDDDLRDFAREAWAWEFLRRNRAYIDAACSFSEERDVRRDGAANVRVLNPRKGAPTPETWGLHFYAAADRPAGRAAVFWRVDVNPAVLPVQCIPASADDNDAFDVMRGCRSVAVLRQEGGWEQILLADGTHVIQLEVRRGSLLDGPVLLRYDLEGFVDLAPKLRTLARLLALRRYGRFPRSLFPPERRARRWLMALKALDASWSGAHARDIATALFGERVVARDWTSASDYLRSRVRRAVAAGECLSNGGYRKLLR